MSGVSDRERYEKLDSMVWKRTKIDLKGRTTIPRKIRKKLRLNETNELLWVSVKQKDGSANEYVLELCVVVDGKGDSSC